MVHVLTDQDWQRIVFALSHFSHNAEFTETLAKVTAYLEQQD